MVIFNLFLVNDSVLFLSIDCLMLGFPSTTTRLVGGTLANKSRGYAFQPWGYGKAGWDPDNYSPVAQKILKDLKNALDSNDKETAYHIMYAIIGNENGVFTQGYGKVFSNANCLLSVHNQKNPKNPILEKEFLDKYDFKYDESDLAFLSKENRGTLLTNVQEILAPKVIMSENKELLMERSLDLQDKVNLSGQSNPEYTIGMFVSSDLNTDLVVYDSDLKVTDEHSLNDKFVTLQNQQQLNISSMVKKQVFGFNIYVVAKKDSGSNDIILSEQQIKILHSFIMQKVADHPKLFAKFDFQNENYLNFLFTGNTKYLNQINIPSPKFFDPQKIYNLPHDPKEFHKFMVRKACMPSSNDRNPSIIIDDDIS